MIGTSLCLISVLYKKKWIMKKINQANAKYKYGTSDMVGCTAELSAYITDYFEKENYKSVVKSKFEDGVFNVPVGYDTILTTIYGDYMKVPSIENQVTHHAYKAFWKE